MCCDGVVSNPDEDAGTRLHRYADERGLSYVEYFDDGEWHAQMIDVDQLTADGFGGNPHEARTSLLFNLGLA